MDALERLTTATSRIRTTQGMNFSLSHGITVLQESVDQINESAESLESILSEPNR
jgi:hypothetical protein